MFAECREVVAEVLLGLHAEDLLPSPALDDDHPAQESDLGKLIGRQLSAGRDTAVPVRGNRRDITGDHDGHAFVGGRLVEDGSLHAEPDGRAVHGNQILIENLDRTVVFLRRIRNRSCGTRSRSLRRNVCGATRRRNRAQRGLLLGIRRRCRLVFEEILVELEVLHPLPDTVGNTAVMKRENERSLLENATSSHFVFTPLGEDRSLEGSVAAVLLGVEDDPEHGHHVGELAVEPHGLGFGAEQPHEMPEGQLASEHETEQRLREGCPDHARLAVERLPDALKRRVFLLELRIRERDERGRGGEIEEPSRLFHEISLLLLSKQHCRGHASNEGKTRACSCLCVVVIKF